MLPENLTFFFKPFFGQTRCISAFTDGKLCGDSGVYYFCAKADSMLNCFRTHIHSIHYCTKALCCYQRLQTGYACTDYQHVARLECADRTGSHGYEFQ
jgi:hypothetical protein